MGFVLQQRQAGVFARGKRGSIDSGFQLGLVVLQAMAEAYPKKLMWGSDSPFQSYVAALGDSVLSLRSTVEQEVAWRAAHQIPDMLATKTDAGAATNSSAVAKATAAAGVAAEAVANSAAPGTPAESGSPGDDE